MDCDMTSPGLSQRHMTFCQHAAFTIKRTSSSLWHLLEPLAGLPEADLTPELPLLQLGNKIS